MGVQGLWRLIEPSGKPVPLETLENKILAVDVSIWLHQAIKGFQDSKGAPLPNAHLLGIYHRVCKLLYFRVKPVFVFDGGVPALKKQTIAMRHQRKNKNIKDANDIQSKLLKTLLKHTAISKVISDKSTSPPENSSETKTKDSIYMLPELPAPELDSTLDSGSSSDESSHHTSPIKQWEYHTIDVKSEHFRSLPADVRHEILTDIIETRKQSSWGRLHEIPTESNDFSSYQMKRLLKRFTVQSTLEETIKEMGGHSLSLGELEQLLKADGIATESGRRIASDENTRYLLIKDVQKAIAEAKDDEEKKKLIKETLEVIEEEPNENKSTNNEYEDDLAAAIQLSLQEEPSSPRVDKEIESKISESEIDSSNDNEYEKDLAAAIQLSLQDQPSTSFSINEEYDSDSKTVTKVTRLQQAKSYMMEYSGLTPSEIDKIINSNKEKSLNKKQNIISKKFSEIKPTEATLTNQISSETITINKSDSEDSFIEVPSTETKKLTNQISSKTITINKSDSEDSFIEVPETSVSENKPVEIMSDSDDSDFVEVKTTKPISLENNITNPSLQIVIDPNKEVKDDIFSDIFNEKQILIDPNKEVKDDIFIFNEKQTEINLENNTKPLETVINKISIENQTESEIKDTKLDETNTISKDKEQMKQIQKPILTVDELSKMKNDLATEQQELIVQRNTKQRIAENITDQMYQEAQELLELFGVPYIIAPMEAEAQCAFLNEIDLTHGTITDDSDIWLFGGKTVYKNFFNHNKHVLEFRAESIEHHFKLTREQLILLALLVGSDYTVGIQGIGPVTALEILAAFPPSRTTNISVLTQAELTSGLNEFKKWLNNSKAIGVARTTLRNKLKNVNIKEGFPSLKVVQAYLQPEVETCSDKFTWSKPDIVGLIDFAKEKFGWTRLKSEEILKPVIKKMEDKNLQKTIKDYFAAQYKNTADIADGKMSKRVKTAVKRLGNKNETPDDENAKQSKPKRTKTTKVDEPSTSATMTEENTKQNKPKTTRKTKKIDEANTTNNTPDEENPKQNKPKRIRKTKIVDEAATSTDTISSQLKTNGKDEETSAENSNKNPTIEETETKIDENKNGGSSKVYSNRFYPHPASIEAKRRVKAVRKEQLHAKQTIPQIERDKKDALKSKLRAIEAFRKSKAGPGFVKKRPKVLTPLKDDAELSESSSD